MANLEDRLLFEERAWEANRLVIGLDEAGRGCYAGPFAMGAVVLDPTNIPDVNDSKQVSEAGREAMADLVRAQALAWGVGLVSAPELDAIGMSAALQLASQRAVQAMLARLIDSSAAANQADGDMVEGLIDNQAADEMTTSGQRELASASASTPIDTQELTRQLHERFGDIEALIDGPNDLCWWLDVPKEMLIKGDGRSVSIGAASIMAKTTRDALMIAADAAYPEYGFAGHKGYGSASHTAALAEHGPCPLHRMSFAPLAPWREQPPSLFD